ncbi:hypothetical protein JT358_08815 [Micrococcales bacterium 31B]|nr:hypothetical protein [Micrococcales bacterium 31B]
MATRSHFVRVSTAETTIPDVAADHSYSGGLNNAATVRCELAESSKFGWEQLRQAATARPAAAARRAGWVISTFTDLA